MAALPPNPSSPISEHLRARIRALESDAAKATGAGLPLGFSPLDAALPRDGLPLSCLHEIAPLKPEWDDGPMTGFCLALLRRLADRFGGPVLWLTPSDDLYAPGLSASGLDPSRLIEGRAQGDQQVLWAMEEGLRSAALIAVVGEVAALDTKVARRLQLAAEAGGVTGFLLRRRGLAPRAGKHAVAATRWQVTAASSKAFGGGEGTRPGPRWQVALLRCRGGRPGSFLMEWDHAAGDFSLVTALRDGPAVPAAASRQSTG